MVTATPALRLVVGPSHPRSSPLKYHNPTPRIAERYEEDLDMDTTKDSRKLLWWQTGVSPDKQADVGKSMLKTAAGWFVVVAVLAVVARVIAA